MDINPLGLEPVQRHVVIRAARRAYRLKQRRSREQAHWRNLLFSDRGWISLSEIAELLHDRGHFPTRADAILFVLRAFRRRSLADGRARYVFDGEEDGFDATELAAVFTQVNETGNQIRLMKDSPEQLMADLLPHLFVTVAEAVEWSTAWGCEWSAASQDATVKRTDSEPPRRKPQPKPPGLGPVYKKGRPPSVQQPAIELMLKMLRAGEITPEELKAPKKTALPGKWGLKGSASSLRAARNEALRLYQQEHAGQKTQSDHF